MFDDGLSLSFRLSRESPYSFRCQRCGVCCNNKRIALSPSERSRLAAFLEIPGDCFAAEYLDPGSGELRTTESADCVFLGPGGCRVHPARPLVCRLFPLGLLRDAEGREIYGVMPVHPDCLGVFGADGTVGGDLDAQGADILLEAERGTD